MNGMPTEQIMHELARLELALIQAAVAKREQDPEESYSLYHFSNVLSEARKIIEKMVEAEK